MGYFNYPCDVAAALRALADDVAALPPDERLPRFSVRVCVQVVEYGGTPDERIAAVDALTFATLGTNAETYPLSSGSHHHGTPIADRPRDDGLIVEIFTAVPAPDVAVVA